MFWTTMWVLGTEPQPSPRATSALNCSLGHLCSTLSISWPQEETPFLISRLPYQASNSLSIVRKRCLSYLPTIHPTRRQHSFCINYNVCNTLLATWAAWIDLILQGCTAWNAPSPDHLLKSLFLKIKSVLTRVLYILRRFREYKGICPEIPKVMLRCSEPQKVTSAL